MTSERQPTTAERLVAGTAAVLSVNPGATMAEIADGNGISRATLHRLYATRDDLLRATLLHALQAVEAALEEARPHQGDPVEALERVIAAAAPLGERFRLLLTHWSWLESDAKLTARAQRLQDELTHLVERGQAEGRLRQDLPSSWQARVIGDLVFSAWAAVADGSLGRREAPAVAFKTISAGLVARKAGTQRRRR